MKHITTEQALGAVGAGLAFFLVNLVSDVRAAMALTARHDEDIKTLSAMRPQVQEILIKMDSTEKAIREMRDRNCFFPTYKKRGE